MYKINICKKLAVASLVLCALLSVASAKPKSKNKESSGKKIPEWTTKPGKYYPSAQYLTGVGSAMSRSDAELQAVTELSSIFGQSVQGTTVASSRMAQFIASDGSATNTSDAEISQSTKNKIAHDNLIGIEIKESFHDEKHNTWYVLAIMDKAKVTANYQSMINRNQKHIELLRSQVATSSDKYTLDNFVRLDFARELALTNEQNVNRLLIINPSAGQAMQNGMTAAAVMQKEARELAQKIPICIVVENDSDNRISKAFAEVMSQAGFNTTTGSNERYKITCDVTYYDDQSTDGKTKFANYTVTGGLQDTSIGEELVPLSFTGREGSPTIENARQRAKSTIVNKIKQNFKQAFNRYLQTTSI